MIYRLRFLHHNIILIYSNLQYEEFKGIFSIGYELLNIKFINKRI